ncbi:uncharacterized protein MELLADRAFT_113510 [Melampsora larici-populina 98AG31]|uniref:DUF4219 domain-containing protein n=1 Tax=Melampsora larici-populina (strain 98AG31 / pathotype 3-4-7) TaxID=747676 RepID=F4SA52_MELLP|nr:uncharacterized protein MELLADRAFT_113510 [Melampsora larici-populina 98AG31]EGF98498.1 hypothetical protein MELLADRAFT_113510 [Melampsora larici-populina 98AG31]
MFYVLTPSRGFVKTPVSPTVQWNAEPAIDERTANAVMVITKIQTFREYCWNMLMSKTYFLTLGAFLENFYNRSLRIGRKMANERILLNSTNYEIWKPKMEEKLQNLHLLEITSRPPLMTQGSSAEDLAWLSILEKEAYDVIMDNLDESSVMIASAYTDTNPKTGSGLWKYLQNRHSINGIINRTMLYKKFAKIQFTTLDTFCDEIRVSIEEFSIAQLEIPKDLLVVMIFGKLPDSFDYRIQLISQDLNHDHDVEYVLGRLEEDDITFDQMSEPATEETNGFRKTS